MKYIIYARVSPRGTMEHETSIQMQIDFCKNYIATQGGEVIKVLYDEFYSGKDMNRPAFQEILSELKNGVPEWDTIACYKLSRLTRSVKDGTSIFELLRDKGKGFVSVTEPNFDFSTPLGRATMSIILAFNQLEREQTAENTKNKMVSIAAAGGWPVGNPPFGYKRGAKHDNTLYVHDRNAEIVKDIFAMYLSDTPVFKIAKKYGRPAQSIYHILKNVTYTGKIPYSGEIYAGRHVAIIPDEQFAAVQKRLPQKYEGTEKTYRPKQSKRPYLLAGILHCGKCGRYMTPANSKSGQYFYYRCTDNINCKHRVSAPKIEELVLRILSKIKLDHAVIEGMQEEAKKRQTERADGFRKEITHLATLQKELKREQDKLAELFLNGTVTSDNSEYFNKKFSQVNTELANVAERMEFYSNQIKMVDDGIPSMIEKVTSYAMSFEQFFGNIPEDPVIQQQMIRAFIREIRYYETGKIEVDFLENESTSRQKNGSGSWIRTSDQVVNSHLLYR